MPSLKLYIFFHLNLMFSSISEEDRKEVLEKCYWPLLNVLQETGIKAGIEASGYTLEIIENLDKNWIKELKKLTKNGQIEVIGSGYTQAIGPLMPATINDWNQQIGITVYEKILGTSPIIALVNEMAFSKGIVEHYLNNGYKSIIMEWNNAYRYNKHWDREYRFFPQTLSSKTGDINLLWADSIAFQKFQRYMHGEIDMPEYLKCLESNNCDGFFPLYSNDVEIFNYRPGRFETEVFIENDEWLRMKELFIKLLDLGFEFVKPSEVLETKDEKAFNSIDLTSSEQPMPVKKQEKYNINRWAVTGRDDLGINTRCERLIRPVLDTNNYEDIKKLVWCWSSDFRTHIVEKRWNKFQSKLAELEKKYAHLIVGKNFMLGNRYPILHQLNNNSFNTKGMEIEFNFSKGMTIKHCKFKEISNNPLFGTLAHGYYDDISFGADFFSGHCIIENPAEHKKTDLEKINPNIFSCNNNVELHANIVSKNIGYTFRYFIEESILKMYKKISIEKRKCGIIHPFNFTFLPEAWDKNTLSFLTHNGGKCLEEFKLADKHIHHSEVLSSLVTSKHALGATEGILIIRDKDKEIVFEHDRSISTLVPSVYYHPNVDEDKFFLRIQYSAQEIDETFRESDEEQIIECFLTITAKRMDD